MNSLMFVAMGGMISLSAVAMAADSKPTGIWHRWPQYDVGMAPSAGGTPQPCMMHKGEPCPMADGKPCPLMTPTAQPDAPADSTKPHLTRH